MGSGSLLESFHYPRPPSLVATSCAEENCWHAAADPQTGSSETGTACNGKAPDPVKGAGVENGP